VKLYSKPLLFFLKIYTFLKAVKIVYKGLSEKNKVYTFIDKEMDQYERIFSSNNESYEPDPISRVFPSGGGKLINNYIKYEDAVQFRTKMKYISKFHIDLDSLDNDGTIRRFMDSLEKLDDEIKKLINKRVISLKKQKKNKEGTVNADLAAIQSKEFKDYYLKLIKND
jgi:hypothetical protein